MIFPKIHKVTISNFSLYKSKPTIDLEFNNGVFCLAGANGLGKSTFISIISYALTGVIVDPQKNFATTNLIPTFFKNNENFSTSYFNGRVDESKRDLANVYVEFSIGSFLYKIKRNFFDITGLLEFSRIDKNNSQETINKSLTSTALLEQYKNNFKRDVGVSTFEQYAFIQSFVLTFDESKKLIFWDEAVMSRVLYLFFGIDPIKADLADDLNKKIGKCESNMRNLQWNITQNTRTLKKLSTNNDIKNLEQIEDTVSQLQDKEDELKNYNETLNKSNSDLDNCDLNIRDLSLKISNLNTQYEEIFNAIHSSDVAIEKDASIVSLLHRIAQKILNEEDVAKDFEDLKNRIFLVSKQLKNVVKSQNFEFLKKIDIELSSLQNTLKEFTLKRTRLEEEISQIKKNIFSTTEFIRQFKTENEKIIEQSLILRNTDIDKKIDSLKTVITQDDQEKTRETKLRDEYKIQLNEIEKDIRKNYYLAEERFLPIFKGYAKSFIGLDIDVELKTSAAGIGLILKVNNTERKDRFQLSESQQYFIDIALRFALIEISASPNAFILIDTPEGSLDIAYESRAGKMFADFAKRGFDLIATANINSSELLLRMAHECKKETMKLERMTTWTILSTVQQEEEGAIETAFQNIEEALNGHR